MIFSNKKEHSWKRKQHRRAAQALHLHIIPNSRVQLKPALAFVDKEFYFFFRSRESVRVQANKIPLGNQHTDCSLDWYLDSTEINSLATFENGIILAASLF